MPHNESATQQIDSGLECLSQIAGLNDIALNTENILHQYCVTGKKLDHRQLRLAAEAVGFKSRLLQSNWQKLQKTPLPAIGIHDDGHFFVVAAINEDHVLLHDPLEAKPLKLPKKIFEPAWTGELILLKTKNKSKTDKLAGFGWFVPFFTRYRSLFYEVLLASVFVQLFALLTPLFFQVIIDKVLVHRGMNTLDVLAAGLLGLAIFEIALTVLRTYVLTHTTSRIDVLLGAKLYRHLLSLPLVYFEKRRIGDSVARLRELENIRQFLSGSSLTLLIDVLFTVIFFVVLYYYSPLLTAIVALSLPVLVIFALLITPLLKRNLSKQFSQGAENQAFLVESIAGMETIKSMALEPRMQKRWEMQLAEYIRSSFKTTKLNNIAAQSASLVSKISTVMILWIGASQVMSGDLSIGQLIAFNMIASRVFSPIMRVLQYWQEYQQAVISVKRLGDILKLPAEHSAQSSFNGLPKIRGAVSFKRVGFRYQPGADQILKNLTLEVTPGQIIGITGQSGCGKSTLAKLIQRLYIPESGSVKIDDVDLSKADPIWLRRQVSVVQQESFLFSMSIRDNIAVSQPGTSLEQIIHVAKLAGAHDFISGLPEGYDTLVEERGSNLSGGQRQRIAIARALLPDPSILIFDEATSALDYESELEIQKNMPVICRGRTVFIIAHRLSALRHADRIIYLENGTVTEQGNHQDLIGIDGRYARLHAIQAG